MDLCVLLVASESQDPHSFLLSGSPHFFLLLDSHLPLLHPRVAAAKLTDMYLPGPSRTPQQGTPSCSLSPGLSRPLNLPPPCRSPVCVSSHCGVLLCPLSSLEPHLQNLASAHAGAPEVPTWLWSSYPPTSVSTHPFALTDGNCQHCLRVPTGI